MQTNVMVYGKSCIMSEAYYSEVVIVMLWTQEQGVCMYVYHYDCTYGARHVVTMFDGDY